MKPVICSADCYNGTTAILIGGPERNKITASFISEADFDALVPGPEGIYIKSYENCLRQFQES